jgi:hypothetical protein
MVDVEEVISHAGHSAPVSNVEVSQSVRVEAFHEDAAGEDGVLHA